MDKTIKSKEELEKMLNLRRNKINEFKENHILSTSEMLFLEEFNYCIELLISKILCCTQINHDVLFQIINNSGKNLENNIILLSYALGIINSNNCNNLKSAKNIRNNLNLVHPLNSSNSNIEKEIKNIELIINQIEQIKIKTNNKNFNEDEISYVIKFVELYSNYELTKNFELTKNTEFKRIIDFANKKDGINLITFILEWMLINPSGSKDEKNLCIIINKLNFEKTKMDIFFKYLNDSDPFLSLIIMSIFITENQKLINEYESDFFKHLNSIFLAWKVKEGMYYEYKRTIKIFRDTKIIEELINKYWLKKDIEQIYLTYFWLLVDGSSYYTISYGIFKYEKIIFEHQAACGILINELKNRPDLIQKRIEFDKKLIEIGMWLDTEIKDVFKNIGLINE